MGQLRLDVPRVDRERFNLSFLYSLLHSVEHFSTQSSKVECCLLLSNALWTRWGFGDLNCGLQRSMPLNGTAGEEDEVGRPKFVWPWPLSWQQAVFNGRNNGSIWMGWDPVEFHFFPYDNPAP